MEQLKSANATQNSFSQLNNESYLFVNIANDTFGIEIAAVREVIELTDITLIPMCSSVIKGVINVRGSVVPVLDMKERLAMPGDNQYDKYSCIVLYELKDKALEEFVTIGIAVKSVQSIESLKFNDMESPPSFGANIPRHFVWKMAKINQRICTILNMETVLNINEINHLLKLSQEYFFANYCSCSK